MENVKRKQEDRFIFLDGLRGLAALCVMIYHYTIFTNFPVFLQAGISVDLFFCLSGFVIASSYSKKISNGMPFYSFALKRLIRLYPTFLIGLAVGFIAIILKIHAAQTNLTDADAMKALSLNAFFLPYFHNSYVLNFQYKMIGEIFPFDTSYWSLFFELFVNIFFFFTVKNSKSAIIFYALALVTFTFTVLNLGAVAQGWGTENFIFGFPRVFVGFFGGVVTFQVYKGLIGSHSARIQNAIEFIRCHSMTFMIALTFVFLLACRGSTHGLRYIYFAEVFIMPVAVLISAFVVPKSPTLSQVATELGVMSYSIYCLQYPILHLTQSINKLDNLHLSTASIVFIATLGTLAATYYLVVHFDKNVRAFLERKGSQYLQHYRSGSR